MTEIGFGGGGFVDRWRAPAALLRAPELAIVVPAGLGEVVFEDSFAGVAFGGELAGSRSRRTACRRGFAGLTSLEAIEKNGDRPMIPA